MLIGDTYDSGYDLGADAKLNQQCFNRNIKKSECMLLELVLTKMQKATEAETL